MKEGQKSEIRILNKVVRETSDGIELEADPRHVELLARSRGVQDSPGVFTPGVKITIDNTSITDDHDKIL